VLLLEELELDEVELLEVEELELELELELEELELLDEELVPEPEFELEPQPATTKASMRTPKRFSDTITPPGSPLLSKTYVTKIQIGTSTRRHSRCCLSESPLRRQLLTHPFGGIAILRLLSR
jgi:hypothetical protein